MRGLKEDVVMSEAKIAAVTGGAGLISSDLFARLLSLGLWLSVGGVFEIPGGPWRLPA